MHTIKIFLTPEDLYLLKVVKGFLHIRIYRADTLTGTFVEVTSSTTRIPLQIGMLSYNYVDDVTPNSKWYKYSFGNDSIESSLTEAFQSQLGDPSKVGWFFGNYMPPVGTFGEVLTADDMRYHYMWGIDAVANDAEHSAWNDAQTKATVDSAVKDMEKWLTIDIYRRKYKCLPVDGTDIKVPIWMEGDENIFTDEEAPYDFDTDQWMNYGFLNLRHRPIIDVSRCQLVGPTGAAVLDLLNSDWLRINKKVGQLNAFPKNQMIFGPAMMGYGSILMWTMRRYPQGLRVDYETGYENSAAIPMDLREIIGKLAAVKVLNFVGDGLLPGFSSQSVSLDGLSEAFSSTQSPTNTFFGARIRDYLEDIKVWLQRNRYKYGSIPLGFVTGS